MRLPRRDHGRWRRDYRRRPPMGRCAAKAGLDGPDRSGRGFAYHLGWILVIAQTLVTGMAELAVGGPFAEADLSDQTRFDPVHTAARQLARSNGGLSRSRLDRASCSWRS